MNWDDVMENAVVPMMEGDSEFVDVLGGLHLYAAQAARPARVPSVEWMIVGDRYTEIFNPIDVQFDYWAKGSDAAVIERRLRNRLHRDTRRVIAGINMSTVYTDSFTHEYPKPGIVHRSLRFRFEPVRLRAARVES